MGTSAPPPDPATALRTLIAHKDSIDQSIQAQLAILKANNVDQHTPLVDAEGFPRADIDIWAVRTARVRLIELHNDLRDVMDKIMNGLQGVYDPSLLPQTENESSQTLAPFARVDGVAPGSPAASAGLLREDLILSFGSLTRSSFSLGSLQPLATLVAGHENKDINIKVLRSNEEITLTFTPRRGWGGKGLLGCHIVPFLS